MRVQVKYAFDKSGETERKTKDDYIAAAAQVIKITADKKTCKTAEKRSSSNNKNSGKQTKPFSIDTSTHSESLDNNNNIESSESNSNAARAHCCQLEKQQTSTSAEQSRRSRSSNSNNSTTAASTKTAINLINNQQQ